MCEKVIVHDVPWSHAYIA